MHVYHHHVLSIRHASLAQLRPTIDANSAPSCTGELSHTILTPWEDLGTGYMSAASYYSSKLMRMSKIEERMPTNMNLT